MANRIKRFCLYGGAGCGKSTLASKIFYDLKVDGYDVALVNEWIKPWAIQGRFPRSHEQLFVFANQQHLEDEILEHVQGLVSDSPLLMNAAYSTKYGFVGAPEIVALSEKFEEEYPGLHFWVHRKHPYRQEGRYQSLEESLEIDDFIQSLMKVHLPQNRTFLDEMSYGNMLYLIKEAMDV